MRASQFHIATVKETPSDAEIISHQLMLRAGFIKRLSSGLYSIMPIGLRVVRKIENIVREEMDDYCMGPTHEEVITDIARKDIRSYKNLPANFYQIQTKFRDEIRPRFGVMRAREFIMKDAYSFHLNEHSLEETFDDMHKAYCAIFDRIGLEYRPVDADSGSIGGAKSREFHVLASSGEDALAYSTEDSFAANVEKAAAVATGERAAATKDMETIDTPGVHTIEDLTNKLSLSAEHCAKTLLVQGTESPVVALVIRGDHQLNAIKAEQQPEVASPLNFASADQIRKVAGCDAGSIGPVGLDFPVLVDGDAALMSDFVCGANHNNQHTTGVNWGRDMDEPVVRDLRNVVEGDPSPTGKGKIKIVRGIEVGHIFQLGTTYSEAMDCKLMDENGKPQFMHMGCYGIGITRVAAAAIEQNHDDKGIIWPDAIAPFTAVISPIHMAKSEAVAAAAESLYQKMLDAGIDVLLDDRALRPGVMFADMELIGIPHRFVVSDKLLGENQIEYKGRRDTGTNKAHSQIHPESPALRTRFYQGASTQLVQ